MPMDKEDSIIGGNPEDKEVITDAAKDQPGTEATANGSTVDVEHQQHQNQSKLTSQYF